MALRLLTYLCLLYQDFVKSGQIRRGKLPPVFPVVIYNGKPRLRATREIANLIAAPASLAQWVPHFRHHLLDEGRVPGDELAAKPDNLLAHLITLETAEARSPAIVQAFRALGRIFRRHRGAEYASLRRTFRLYFQHTLRPDPDDAPDAEAQWPDDFDEVATMYATRWQESLAKVEAETRRDTEAAMLLRQITKRFGPPGVDVEKRLRKAKSADLERWADNFVDAGTLEDVFRPK